jgi:hypothetical protein
MATFKATDGREYSTAISMGVIRRTEQQCGERITTLFLKPELRERWFGIDTEFVTLLYHVLKPQIDAAGLTQEQFEETLSGDATADAHRALLEDLRDFSREPLKGLLTRCIQDSKKLEAEILLEAQRVVDSESARMDQVDLKSLAKELIPTSSDSSTPASAG